MIRTIHTLIISAAALTATSAIATPAEKTSQTAAPAVSANVIGLDGASLGTVSLRETPTGVLVTTDLKGLPEGDRGFHFHEKGVCNPADKFASAGAHFAAGADKHGLMVEGGPHGGDMPNQHVGADGLLKTQILNTGVTLAAGSKSLKDADGSALVIHAGPDDYVSQPSGDAGSRIACAVISAPR